MKIVVLGVGNLIMSDEGVGVQVVQELESRYHWPDNVRVIDGGTSGMDLLGDLAGVDRLLILDAVHSGAAPGSLVILEGEDVPVFYTTKLSPHQTGLCDVLADLRLLGESPGETVIIGVEPASLELGMDLSGPVAAAVPRVKDELFSRLRALGVTPRPRG